MTPAVRDPAIRAVLGRPFEEQVAFFRAKLGNLIPTARWDEVWKAQHDKGFMVAGAQAADLLTDLAVAVARSSVGGTLAEFRKDFDAIVQQHGWSYTGERNWRTRTIYKTNTATSYAAGRLAQLREGNFPFWMYKHGGSTDPRPQHLAWDGLVLPPDHPFWTSHSPPNGWGCSCRIVGVRTRDAARRLGGDPDKALPEGWDAIDAATGEPAGIDPGWGYQPGASLFEKVAQLPPQIGAGLVASLPAGVIAEQRARYRQWLQDLDTEGPAKSRRPVIGALTSQLLAGLKGLGVEPKSAAIAVSSGPIKGPKARRHEVDGDALSPETWRQLPEMMENPVAVLYQAERNRLLFVLAEDGDRRPQLTVELDIGQPGNAALNLIISAYRPPVASLKSRKGLVLLFGKLE